MRLQGNTVLVTGGSEGIGFALASRFAQRGNTVIVCGRRIEKLAAAKARCPQLITRRCDVADTSQREDLAAWVAAEYPDMNVLVNNAGIQNRHDIWDAGVGWASIEQELCVNLAAPIHLSKLFVPHLERQKEAVIINVSSGLAFLPPVRMPVYGATKAGLHSFTFCAREQLRAKGIEVVEILPTATNTNLGGAGVHAFGADVDAFADSVFCDLEAGRHEIGFQDNLKLTHLPRAEIEARALEMARR